jgi:hypothetical protein
MREILDRANVFVRTACWKLPGAGVVVLGNYKALPLAQTAIKNHEREGL